MNNLAHSASFESLDKNAPSKSGTKHLGRRNAMKKFLALYMADASGMAEMMKNSTPEQRKQGTEAWMKWMDDNKASLADRGAPVGKTKRIDAKGIKDAKNDVCGYSIVQAESADEAARIFGKDQPFLQMPGATIDMIEIMEMPGT